MTSLPFRRHAAAHRPVAQTERQNEYPPFTTFAWRIAVLGKILFESILSISTSTGTQKVIKILF